VVYQIDVLEDGCFAGFALIHRRFGSVLEFHFGPFLPVVFGAAPANGHGSFAPKRGRGITHSLPQASGAQRRAARNEAKRSGGSLGKPEWRREGACRPIRPSSEALPELAGTQGTMQTPGLRAGRSGQRTGAIVQI
jgi:hypothetical protein